MLRARKPLFLTIISRVTRTSSVMLSSLEILDLVIGSLKSNDIQCYYTGSISYGAVIWGGYYFWELLFKVGLLICHISQNTIEGFQGGGSIFTILVHPIFCISYPIKYHELDIRIIFGVMNIWIMRISCEYEFMKRYNGILFQITVPWKWTATRKW